MTDPEPTDAATSGSSRDLELDWPTLMHLVNCGASRAIYWHVSEMLDSVDLADEEVDALLKLPMQYRQTVAASLLDYAEVIREASRDLDAQIMRLTGELV